MKNKFIYAIIFGATVFFSACSSSSKKESKEANSLSEKTFYEIDLSKDFTDSNCDNMLLSDIVEDVEYVQLETTDTNLLECYPRVKYALTKDDMGRKFKISLRVFDTVSRYIAVELNHCTSMENSIADYNRTCYNFITKENEWMEISFDYTAYEYMYEEVKNHRKTLSISCFGRGVKDTPIYFTDIKVTEEISSPNIEKIGLLTFKKKETILPDGKSEIYCAKSPWSK